MSETRCHHDWVLVRVLFLATGSQLLAPDMTEYMLTLCSFLNEGSYSIHEGSHPHEIMTYQRLCL